jgi:hypothetical protein
MHWTLNTGNTHRQPAHRFAYKAFIENKAHSRLTLIQIHPNPNNKKEPPTQNNKPTNNVLNLLCKTARICNIFLHLHAHLKPHLNTTLLRACFEKQTSPNSKPFTYIFTFSHTYNSHTHRQIDSSHYLLYS